MVPADLASRARRWRLTSSATGQGFQADSATVEYASIDAVTYQAVADTINNANDVTDVFDIVVMVDTVPVEIFRGTVVSWELEERYSQGVRETIGVLTAQDRRGALNRIQAPDDLTFRGVEVSPWTGARITHDTLADAMGELCDRVGLPVTFTFDYPLTQNVVTAGMSVGQAIAHLLEPAQQAEGLRADFVRRGDVYLVTQRTIPLGTPDVTIAASLVNVRRYRKTRPRPPIEGRSVVGYATEHGGGVAVADWDDLPQSGCWSLSVPNGSGEICRTYFGRRLIEETMTKTLTPPNGLTSTIVDARTFSYDSLLGLLTGHQTTTTQDGALRSRDDHFIHHDQHGRKLGDETHKYRVDRTGTLVLAEIVVQQTSETEAGTFKTITRERITNDRIIPADREYEFSAGDTSSIPDSIDLGTRLRREPSDVPVDVSAQVDLYLLECTVDIPLDVRIMAGMVVEFSGAPSLVTDVRFYVTGMDAAWEAKGVHRQSLTLEAWVA